MTSTSVTIRFAFRATVGIVASVLMSSAVFAHFDIVPYSDGSKLLTGGHDHGVTPKITVESMNVYGYEFDDFPNDIGDPGINNSSSFTNGVFVNNGLLPAGMLSFSVYSGSYGSLHYWDGSGSPSFSPVTDGVEITLTSALGSLSIGGATTSGTLDLKDIPGIGPSAGRVHDHLDSGISSSALAGIYAFGGVLSTAAPGVANSDPIYLVYNVGASEEAHEAAVAFYETLSPTAVPEIDPSSLAAILAMVGGSLSLLERRRAVARAA